MDQRLEAALEDYLSFHQELDHTVPTVKFYRKELRLFFTFLRTQDHPMRVVDVTARDVRDHLKYLLDNGRKARTRRTRLQAIKTFLNWCVDWEYIESNPAVRVKAPKSDPPYKPFPSTEAFGALLEQCPLDDLVNSRRAAILWLFVSTGIRRRELNDLQLKDLHFGGEGWIDIQGKGGRYRTSALLESFQAPVQQALETYLSFRTDDLPWLWVTKFGQRLGYDRIGKDMELLAELAGVKDEIVDICHGWRRYCAVQAQEQGVDPVFILTNLGWTSYTMFNHYTRARLEERKRAVQAFQNFAPGLDRLGGAIQSRPAAPVPSVVPPVVPPAVPPLMPMDGPAVQWYADLQLPLGASSRRVKAAFQRLSRSCHPSLHPGDAAATEFFQRINAAQQGLTKFHETKSQRLR